MTSREEDTPRVRQISAPELAQRLDSPAPPVLIDVRTPAEREIACIAGSRLLDEAGHACLMSLDRGTPVVFACHHGIRSQAAAEYFLHQGFREVYNLAGGIEAWSRLVDPSVPRY